MIDWIRHSEIKFQSDFSKFAFNRYKPFRLLEMFENNTSEIEFVSSNHSLYYN